MKWTERKETLENMYLNSMIYNQYERARTTLMRKPSPGLLWSFEKYCKLYIEHVHNGDYNTQWPVMLLFFSL